MCMYLGILEWIGKIFEKEVVTEIATEINNVAAESGTHIYAAETAVNHSDQTRKMVDEIVQCKMSDCNTYIKRKIAKRVVDIQTQLNVTNERLDNIAFRLINQSQPQCECQQARPSWHAYM